MLLKKEIIENKMGKMLVLVGSAMRYISLHNSLDGFEEYYYENREKVGFHFRSQKYGDKIIREELKTMEIYCRKGKTKRYYRYSLLGKNSIEKELYHYFKYIMDYILENELLFNIVMESILKDCECPKDSDYKICLNKILDWQYQRLVNVSTSFTGFSVKKKELAKEVLKEFNGYSRLTTFKKQCQSVHGIS